MVKLDVSLLRYLSSDDIRVLTSVEMGQKNHELVPASLVASISSLGRGGISKILNQLTRHKLLSYEAGKRFDGYRLTYKGYDYLALNVFRHRNVLHQVGNQIGVGKESDVFIAADEEGQRMVLKLHRLGRVCFRKVNDKRDYQKNGAKVHSFFYLSRLAAKREFAFMTALHQKGYRVPRPIEYNRHCVVMELMDGQLLNHISSDAYTESEATVLYDKLMELIISLANDCGVVHGDLNEFNLIIDNNNEPVLFDFPQMIGVDHQKAEEYFERDVNCIADFFEKRFNFVSNYRPTLDKEVSVKKSSNFVQNFLENDLDYNETDIKEELDQEVEEISEEEKKEIYNESEDDEKEVRNEQNQCQTILHNSESKSSQKSLDDEPLPLDDRLDQSNRSASCSPDRQSVSGRSNYVPSVAGSSIAPEEVRSRLKREQNLKNKREELKRATRKIKGDANVVRRERRHHVGIIKEDIATHKVEPFNY